MLGLIGWDGRTTRVSYHTHPPSAWPLAFYLPRDNKTRFPVVSLCVQCASWHPVMPSDREA